MAGNYSSDCEMRTDGDVRLDLPLFFMEIAVFFVSVMALYVCYLAPEITSNDAGELAAAA